MIESLQIALYPLGFIPSLFFGARFLLQWLFSEKKGESIVPKTFWSLSFFGNLTLAIHSMIQMQAHILVMQIINGFIALRNINLMGMPKKRWRLQSFLISMLAAIFVSLLMLFVFCLNQDNGSFFRVPIAPWDKGEGQSVSWIWHLLGSTGLLLFSTRFIIQWFLAEKAGKSILGKSFWWTSLLGDILCLAYFVKLGDSVNFIGPIFGLIPYVRNLMLIYKKRGAYET